MTYTIYHNPKCSKSRETLEILNSKGGETRIVEYLKNPPSKEELEGIIQKLNIQPTDLIRFKEEKPKNLLESIIRDSDLEYLGSEDFIKISPLLKKEWINCDVVKSDSEFYKIQYKFISNHNFYTDFMIKNIKICH